jgi:aminoglycoside 3-N-acetyltransferase
MLRSLLSKLPPQPKSRLRGFYLERKKRFVDTFLSYSPEELEKALAALGVKSGSTLLVHSSFNPYTGFHGSPEKLIDVFLKTVGSEGNLLMVSLPYSTSSISYLQRLNRFDVRNTPSRMGMVSELFRRRPGVLRSLHPTHPMLAYGPKAEWIVAGHEDCLYPCGPGTPFEKLAQLNGKILFFYVGFTYLTFFHYLEHLVHKKLPFPLYTDKPFDVPVIDWNGQEKTVKTHVFTPEVIKRRRFEILEQDFWRRGVIKKGRVGATQLLLVDANEAIIRTQEMTAGGVFFYELS